jgi:two-component system response regulator NreC
VRVLLADDHQVVREGIRILLERGGCEIVAETGVDHYALQMALTHRPDVAVLDFSSHGADAIACAEALRVQEPQLGIILLTVHSDEHKVASALRVGVRGYVLKTQASGELLQAIREVAAGGTFLSAKVSHVVTKLYVEGGYTPNSLTPRQREVLALIGDGLTTHAAAERLGVSDKTVELYRSRLMERLDIHDTAGLVRYAIRCGLSKL